MVIDFGKADIFVGQVPQVCQRRIDADGASGDPLKQFSELFVYGAASEEW